MSILPEKPGYFQIMEYPPPVYPIPHREPFMLPDITNGLLPEALLPAVVNRMPRAIRMSRNVQLALLIKLPYKMIKTCGKLLHEPFLPHRLKLPNDHLPGVINEKPVNHLPPVSLLKNVVK